MSQDLTRNNARIFYEYYEARDFGRDNVKGHPGWRVETQYPDKDHSAQYRIQLIRGKDVYFPKDVAKPKEELDLAVDPRAICRFRGVTIDDLDRSVASDDGDVFLATLEANKVNVWDLGAEDYTVVYDLLVRLEKVTFEERSAEPEVGIEADIVIDELVLVADHEKLGGLVVTEWLTNLSRTQIETSLCKDHIKFLGA